MNESLKSEIELHCYLVNCGKPCSLITIKISDRMDAKEIAFNNKLNSFTRPLKDDWKEFWIYKKDFMFEVIKALPDKPKTTYDHWVLGKAFGYSDEAIEEFLTTSKVGTVASGAGRQSV